MARAAMVDGRARRKGLRIRVGVDPAVPGPPRREKARGGEALPSVRLKKALYPVPNALGGEPQGCIVLLG